jgi:hypothetical protein
MKPQRFPIENIPFDQMWESDKIWLPEMLTQNKNTTSEYHFSFDENNKLITRKKF